MPLQGKLSAARCAFGVQHILCPLRERNPQCGQRPCCCFDNRITRFGLVGSRPNRAPQYTQSPSNGRASPLTLTCRLMGMSLYQMSEFVPSTHAAPGHTATARMCASMNHFVSLEPPRCVSRRPAPSTYTALPVTLVASLTEKYGCPVVRASRFVLHWPPRATYMQFATCLTPAFGSTMSFKWCVVARHVARGVELKSQSGTPPRPAEFNSELRAREVCRAAFAHCCAGAWASGSRVATQARRLSPRRTNP